MLTGPLQRGRGAPVNRLSSRFDTLARDLEGDWLDAVEELDGTLPLRTEVAIETPRTIISRNSSPDIPFDRSINAYRGCEHVMPGRAGSGTASDSNAESLFVRL